MEQQSFNSIKPPLKEIPVSLVNSLFVFLGSENVRWFRLIKHLKGDINCVLKLNFKRKRIPVHPIHFREGMQIRNFLRGQPECKDWTNNDFDNNWAAVVEACFHLIKK